MAQINLVVVDDHPLFRQGVVNALQLEPDLIIAGQATNGEDAFALILKTNPDIALVDVNLPGMNGLQLTRQLASLKLLTRVILLTAYDDEDQQAHGLRAGAAAYCTKDVQPEMLVEIIRQVMGQEGESGAVVLPGAELAAHMNGDAAEETLPPLSSREMEVLTCVTRGLSNKEIAGVLGISHQTVKNHMTAILRKLGVEDRTQAAIFALKRGWVRLNQPESKNQE